VLGTNNTLESEIRPHRVRYTRRYHAVHSVPTRITGSKPLKNGVNSLWSHLVLIVFRLEGMVLLVLVEGSQGFFAWKSKPSDGTS
jgi:hypothetical protein